MLFDSWSDLFRIVVVGALAYVALVGFLRLSGKRTLAKMNAFDLVVTVALGSTLATILLNRDITLSEGIVAFGVLCALQYCVAFLAVRSRRFRQAVKSEPTLLFRSGEYLRAAMRGERVTEDEIRAAIRAAGNSDATRVGAVVLETDGTFSVMSDAPPAPSVLHGVETPDR